MGDTAGLPSGIIESFHLRTAMAQGPAPATLIRILSVQRPLLVAGRQYWVVAAGGTPTTFALWNTNAINDRGPNVSGPNLSTLVRNADTNAREALRVIENTITGLVPNSATAGGPSFALIVNGSNFPPNSPISWNGTALATTYVSPSQLRATVPASLIPRAGTATVAVGDSGAATFTVNPAPQPALVTISPASGPAAGPGFVLTVTGTNFVSWSKVLWNGSELVTTYVSAMRLDAAVPAHLVASAGGSSITVANAADAVSNAVTFLAVCNYTVVAGGPSPLVIPAGGGSGSVTVTAAPGCPWTAASDVPWITIPSGASGSGTGLVLYAVAANGGPARTAALTIAGQTIAINQPAAQPVISTPAVSAASFSPGLASGAWIAIFGTNLSLTTRTWTSSDFAGDRLPTRLDGVGVNINGKPAYVYYISSTQVNVLAPEDPALGPVAIEVVNLLGRSNVVATPKQAAAPAWFALTGPPRRYAAAVLPDGTILAPLGLLPGVTTRAGKPGDAISLFASGLGPTEPPYPEGMIIRQPAPLKNPISVRVAGMPAVVDFAGIVGAGLYQINVQIPDVPDGDAVVVVEAPGFGQDQAYITIQR